MVQQPGNGLVKVVIELIHSIGLRVCGFTDEASSAAAQLPQGFADVRVIGKVFGDNVQGTGNGLFRCSDTFFLIDKVFGEFLDILTVLGEDSLSQRVQTLFPGYGASGAALLLIWPVQVLHLRHGGSGIDCLGQLLGQLTLILDGFFYFIPSLLQIPQVGEPGLQVPQGGVVHGPMHFLPVSGDKGNGVALIDEVHHIFNVLLLLSQFLSQNFDYRLHS